MAVIECPTRRTSRHLTASASRRISRYGVMPELDERVRLAAHRAIAQQRTDDHGALRFRQTSHGIVLGRHLTTLEESTVISRIC